MMSRPLYEAWPDRLEREKIMSRRRANGYKAVQKAIKNGDLPPANFLRCFDCWAPAECYDHRDYRKPLDVWPVCKGCDVKRGAGEPYDGRHWTWDGRRKQTAEKITKQRISAILQRARKR